MKIYLYPTSFGILPSDFCVGPSKFARNDAAEGDPHSMSMSRYKRDFLETREDVAKKLNLPTTDPMVRAEARFIVRHEHYEPDLRASQVENSGALEYETERQFAIINGQATYLNKDGSPSKFTFSNFHERTLNDKNSKVRDSYSEEAHKLDLLLQSAIANATKPIEVTKFAHDVKGIRDAYTFSYDPIENKGKIRVRNMAPDGKFLSTEEAQQKMRDLFPDKKEISVSENVFILINSPSSSAEKIISLYERSVHEKIENIASKAVINTIIEIHSTGQAIVEFMDRKKEKENIIEERSQLVVLLADPNKSKALEVLSGEGLNESIEKKTEKEIIDLWLTKAEETLHITPEQSEKLLEEVQKAWVQMEEDKKTLLIINETGVGVAGAVYLLGEMALLGIHNEPDQLSETWTITQGAKEVISVAAKENVFIPVAILALGELAAMPAAEEIIVTEPIVLTEKEKDEAFSLEKIPDSVDAVVLKETVEFIREIDVLPIEEQKKAIVEEKEKVEEKIVQVWEAITLEKPAVASLHAPSELVDLEPKEKTVEQFSFAFAIWMVLKLLSYRSALETLEPPLLMRIKKEKPEGLIQKETGQWILFAIIWYLAMIREQGVQSNPVPPAQKKKKVKEVIIFAYVS